MNTDDVELLGEIEMAVNAFYNKFTNMKRISVPIPELKNIADSIFLNQFEMKLSTLLNAYKQYLRDKSPDYKEEYETALKDAQSFRYQGNDRDFKFELDNVIMGFHTTLLKIKNKKGIPPLPIIDSYLSNYNNIRTIYKQRKTKRRSSGHQNKNRRSTHKRSA